MDSAASRGTGDFGSAGLDAAGSAASEGDSDVHEASLLAPFERVFAAFKRIASQYATLAVLDVRRAAVQFAWLVAGGILIAVLLVTAWLAAVVALGVWLLADGMSWPAVLLVGAALNLVGAALVGLRIRNVFDHVPFSATLRQIKTDDTPSPAIVTPHGTVQ